MRYLYPFCLVLGLLLTACQPQPTASPTATHTRAPKLTATLRPTATATASATRRPTVTSHLTWTPTHTRTPWVTYPSLANFVIMPADTVSLSSANVLMPATVSEVTEALKERCLLDCVRYQWLGKLDLTMIRAESPEAAQQTLLSFFAEFPTYYEYAESHGLVHAPVENSRIAMSYQLTFFMGTSRGPIVFMVTWDRLTNSHEALSELMIGGELLNLQIDRLVEAGLVP